MRRFLSALALSALALGALTAPATAADFDGAPHLLRDALPGANGSNPDAGAVLGNKLVYLAGTVSTGYEPWVSDGTKAGTKILRDIYPGATGSGATRFATFKGNAYFAAGDAAHGNELWRTNGTSGGTQRVADLTPGSVGSYPGQFVVAGSKLFFVATTPGHGQELWTYDGTATTLVKEIAPGAPNAQIIEMVRWGSKVAFRAEDADGAEPWVSDGTVAGTHTLGNISTGSAGSFPDEFTAAGDKLYFAAHPAGGNRTVFMTTGGTTSSQVSTANFDTPFNFLAYGNRVLFTATNVSTGRELWITDGNDAGTVLIKDIRPGVATGDVQDLTAYQGKIYFAANDDGTEPRLWVTDGTTANTQRVTTDNGSQERFPGNFAVADGLLYFSASQVGGSSIELWQTNGTAAGTRSTRSTAPGAPYTEPLPLAVVGNTLFFSAYDAAHGAEVWAYTTRSSTTTGASKSVTKKIAAQRKIYVTIKVSATGTTPIGKVVLKKGATVIGSAPLSGGKAKIRITKKLAPGKHKIRAYYSGSVRARTSHSKLITIKVG